MTVTRLIPTMKEIRAFGVAAARNESEIRDVPVNRYQKGDMSSLFLTGAAAIARTTLESASERFYDCFVNFAEAEALDIAIANKYPLLGARHAATNAVVQLYLYRSSLTGGAGSIAAGKRVKAVVETTDSSQSPVFTLTDTATFSATQYGCYVAAECTDTGVVGNVEPGTITTWIDTIFDTNITVTNQTCASGGNPAETDEHYRSRALTSASEFLPGTIDYIRMGLLKQENVWYAIVQDDTSGNIWAAVADASGLCGSAMLEVAREGIMDYAGAGTNPILYPIVRRYQPINVTLICSKNTNLTAAINTAKTNLLGLNQSYTYPDRPLGPCVDLTIGRIDEACSSPSGVIRSDIQTPTTTVKAAFGQWITLDANYINLQAVTI